MERLPHHHYPSSIPIDRPRDETSEPGPSTTKSSTMDEARTQTPSTSDGASSSSPIPTSSAHHSPFPHSTEGDCTGCSYGPDGQLLIGGLAVDGSTAGEAGWASRESRRQKQQQQQQRRLGFGAFASTSRKTPLPSPVTDGQPSTATSFQACTPREGPSTFAQQQQQRPTQQPPNPQHAAASLSDIIEGRTCRPIALLDLRTFLALRKERQEQAEAVAGTSRTTSITALPSMMQLADLNVSDSQQGQTAPSTTTMAESSHHGMAANGGERASSPTPQSQATGELNALNFVVAFDRYTRLYRANGSQAPSRSELQETFASRPGQHPTSMQEIFDGGIDPSSQPLRERYEAMISTYLGDLPLEASPRKSTRTYRLDWLMELGLLDEDAVSEALYLSACSTNPDLLLPLVNTVVTYLNTHVLPAFLADASRNLSKDTARGRLAVGVVCTALAVLFSILLCLEPSPLTGTRITRWYRILTFPLWAAGVGYIIAAFTKVCVWLSLRGNREPRQDELVDGIRTPRTSNVGAGGGISGDVEKANHAAVPAERDEYEEGNLSQVDQSRWMIAPEIWGLMTKVMPFLRNKDWNRRGGGDTDAPKMTPSTSQSSGVSPVETSPIGMATVNSGLSVPPQAALGPKVKSKSVSVPGTSVEFGMRTVVSNLNTSTDDASFNSDDKVTVSPRVGGVSRSRSRQAGPSHLVKAWTAMQRWTGFAVGTERIRDERIRKVHQRAALRALLLDGVASVIATIVVVAIP